MQSGPVKPLELCGNRRVRLCLSMALPRPSRDQATVVQKVNAANPITFAQDGSIPLIAPAEIESSVIRLVPAHLCYANSGDSKVVTVLIESRGEPEFATACFDSKFDAATALLLHSPLRCHQGYWSR